MKKMEDRIKSWLSELRMNIELWTGQSKCTILWTSHRRYVNLALGNAFFLFFCLLFNIGDIRSLVVRQLLFFCPTPELTRHNELTSSLTGVNYSLEITCTVAACVTFHFFLKELPTRLQKMKSSNSKLIFSANSCVKSANTTIKISDINSVDSSFICIHTRAEDKTIQDNVDLVTASVHTEHLSAETSGATQGATHNDEQIDSTNSDLPATKDQPRIAEIDKSTKDQPLSSQIDKSILNNVTSEAGYSEDGYVTRNPEDKTQTCDVTHTMSGQSGGHDVEVLPDRCTNSSVEAHTDNCPDSIGVDCWVQTEEEQRSGSVPPVIHTSETSTMTETSVMSTMVETSETSTMTETSETSTMTETSETSTMTEVPEPPSPATTQHTSTMTDQPACTDSEVSATFLLYRHSSALTSGPFMKKLRRARRVFQDAKHKLSRDWVVTLTPWRKRLERYRDKIHQLTSELTAKDHLIGVTSAARTLVEEQIKAVNTTLRLSQEKLAHQQKLNITLETGIEEKRCAAL